MVSRQQPPATQLISRPRHNMINMKQDRQTELPPVVFAIDEGYVEACCVALRSHAETTPNVDLIDVFVLFTALRPESRRLLARSAGDLRLRLRQVGAVDRRFPVIGRVTEIVYLRLQIATALPEFDKAVYLDADVQVMDDIVPLLCTDLQGRAVGAVRDPQNPVLGLGVALPGWERLGLTGDREYFNSGVLVLDLI